MAEKKAAVEVKQEGEFTLKGKVKPKKPKQLGKKVEIAKVDLSKDPNVKIEEPIKVDHCLILNNLYSILHNLQPYHLFLP